MRYEFLSSGEGNLGNKKHAYTFIKYNNMFIEEEKTQESGQSKQ